MAVPPGSAREPPAHQLRHAPVSWPTWEKVYCRPSASWNASTLPSLNCTLASTTSLVRRRICVHASAGEEGEKQGQRACAAKVRCNTRNRR